MAIELEYKYILKNNPSFEKDIILFLDRHMISHYINHIKQYYLKGGGRVRSSTIIYEHKIYSQVHEFTYKDFIGVGEGNIEFNQYITEDEFNQCLAVSNTSLDKSRYIINVDGYKWEIDIFKDEGLSYFNLMEVEVSHGEDPSIDNLPSIIKDNIILKTLDDYRFTSKKLADKEYAKNLYIELESK